MLGFKNGLIWGIIFVCFVSLKSDQDSAFPEFLQADLETLFGIHSDTFTRLQVFAQDLEKSEQRVITSKNLEAFLAAKDLKTFARYLASEQFAKRLDKLQEKNPILVALAKKWIRNAALRVFADPLRSFLEPIANACDATAGPGKFIGKFGLGFFSILSFLSHQETDGTIINVKTAYNTDFEQNKTFAYSMTFEKTGSDIKVWDDLVVKFNKLKEQDLSKLVKELNPSFKPGSDMPTGTIVSITPKNKQFSDATLNSLKNYVAYMVNYRYVPIYLNNDSEPINKAALTPEAITFYPVNVFIQPNELKVVDRGFGISIPVALSSLLIPSSSTKPKFQSKQIDQSDVVPPSFVKLPYKKDITDSHFLITVNGAVVVDRVISSPIKNENGRIIDFKIEMPQSTQLTIARDEILISEDGKSFEEAYLKNIINKTITDAIDHILPSEYLIALYHGLLSWELQSAARYIKGRFTNYFKESLQEQLQKNEMAVAIPVNYFDKLQKIMGYFAGSKIQNYSLFPVDGELVNYDFSKFENILWALASSKTYYSDEAIKALMQNALNYQLIRGMRVFFVPENILDKISTLGMYSLLFVPESELNDPENIEENIATKCTDFDLTSFDKNDSLNYTLLISTFSNSLVSYPEQSFTDNDLKIISKDLAYQFLKKYKFLLNIENGKRVGVLANKFILSLFGIEALPEFNEAEYFLNFILTSMLSKFGVNAKNAKEGRIYFVDSLGNFNQLWPMTSVDAENIAKVFVALIWFQSNNSEQYFSDDIDFKMSAKDYCMRLFYKSITLDKVGVSAQDYNYFSGGAWFYSIFKYIDPVIEPFKFLGFNLKPINQQIFRLDNSTKPVFVGRRGVAKDIIESEIKDLIKFVAPAANYDQTLKFSCNNIDLVSAFVHLFLIKKSSEQIIKDKASQLQILGLIETLCAFYMQYCNIPENEFQKIYGRSNKINVLMPVAQIDASMIVQMLNAISARPKTFERILQLQVDDFSQQTSLAFRSVELIQNTLYLPLITANTVLSALTRFFYLLSGVNTDRRLAIMSQVVDLARNAKDFVFILSVLMVNSNLNLVKSSISKLPDNKFQSFLIQINDLIQRYIHDKVDDFAITDFYEKCRDKNFITFESRLKLLDDTQFSKIVYEYLQASSFDVNSFERHGYLAELEAMTLHSKPFTLRKLMRAHFTGDGLIYYLQNNDLKSALRKVYKVKDPVDSWKITQSVEAGSQRDAFESASVECLQNSVDIIKGFFKKLKNESDPNSKKSFDLRLGKVNDLCSIKFDLSIVPENEANKSQLLLTIQDFIGMPSLETLLADLVLPDYSKKTPAQGNIGDMGNGTFKIYQDAKSVVVTTRLISDPNSIFILHITPHRNLDGLVDDLDLVCTQKKVDEKWQDFWGTRFEILFMGKDRSESIVSFIAAKDFLKNCIGTTNVLIEEQQTNVKVYFKNELLNKFLDDDLLYEHKMNHRVVFKVFKREHNSLQSYFTTGGVPFRPLASVAREMALMPQNFIPGINWGLVINLELGTYQPVQSRTRLNISEEIMQNLKDCLLEAFYIYTLDRYQKDLNYLGSLFTHLASKIGDFQQLKLDAKDLRSFTDNKIVDKRLFFGFYRSAAARKNSWQRQKSFFEFINKEYEGGLVKSVELLRSEYQSFIDKAFKDTKFNDQEYEDFCENKKGEFKSELNTLFNEWKIKIIKADYSPATLINFVVIPWFEAKIGGVFLKEKNRGQSKRTLDIANKYKKKFANLDMNDIRSLLIDTLSSYVNAYFKLNKLTNAAPKVLFERCSEGELGYFSKSSNKIVISPSRFMLITDTLTMLKSLLVGHYQDVKNNKAYEFLFGIRKGSLSGIVVHELLHVVTNSDHSYHAIDFEDLAKQRVMDIIANLYPEWRNQVFKISGKSEAEILKLIDKNIDNVKNIEREDQDALLKILNIF